jgi:hypothetical protein
MGETTSSCKPHGAGNGENDADEYDDKKGYCAATDYSTNIHTALFIAIVSTVIDSVTLVILFHTLSIAT